LLLVAPLVAVTATVGAFLFVARAAPGGADLHSPPPGLRAEAASCEGPACAELVEMEVRDVVPLEEANTHAVVLVSKDQKVLLPIFVDESSAVSIAFRLAHVSSPHPLAQDLLDQMLVELGGELTEVRIDRIEDTIVQGRVLITQGGRKLSLEARPSDSISMALTCGAKIFATRAVLQEAGLTSEDMDRLRQEPGVGGSGPGGEISL
jgi:hypothetical protein